MPAADTFADTLRRAIEPWEKYPDDVLWDVADTDGATQVLRVNTPEGSLWTDASVAQMVLGVRGIIRACAHHR